MARAKQTAGGSTRRNRERKQALSNLMLVISLVAVFRLEETK